jgi:hypothetical protein
MQESTQTDSVDSCHLSQRTTRFALELYSFRSIDPCRLFFQHGHTMTEVIHEVPRRSSRVFMRIRVVAAGKNARGRKFREACNTIVVNAHGGLILLPQEIEMGAMVVLTNPFTWEELESRVVFVGEESDKGRRVGVEFLCPAPHFWGVEFTPPDWQSKQDSQEPSAAN